MERSTIIHRSLITASFVFEVLLFSPFIEYTLMTLFFMAVYVWLNSKVRERYPGTIKLDGKETFLFRLYVSFIHDGIAGILMIITLSLHYFVGTKGGLNNWFLSGWEESFTNSKSVDMLLNILDLIALTGTMAYEMKDGIVDDFYWSVERVGIYLHHVATVGVCLSVLNTTFGRGYCIVNGLQCLVGSAIYCIWRLKKLNTIIYCICMTISNTVAAWISYEFYLLGNSRGTPPTTYAVLATIIIFVRMYPVVEVIINELRQFKLNKKMVRNTKKIE